MEKRKKTIALLLIDLINDFSFDDGDELYEATCDVVTHIAALKKAARAAGVPVIYVNDNFQNWRDDFKATLKHVLGAKKGADIARKLRPAADDYFVLKPKHSGFYSTALDLLLNDLKVSKLVFTGITTDICVMLTANDAYMRNYKIVVATDCVAAVTPGRNKTALDYMQRVLKSEALAADQVIAKYF